MAENHLYLTVDKNPNGKGLLAVISMGSPQLGDAHVEALDLEICKNMKAAKGLVSAHAG